LEAASTIASGGVDVSLGPGLLFGLMLLAALIGGHLAHLAHVPRVVGFVVAGVLLRAALHAAVGAERSGTGGDAIEVAAQPLNAIKDLALGLILFLIGSVFERSRLRAVGARVLRISTAEVLASAVLVFVGCVAVAVSTQPSYDTSDNVIFAMLLALAAIATAPAATLFVLQEYESKGPVTDTILGLTGSNNVVCIVLFYAVFLTLASFGAISSPGPLAQHVWLALGLATIGSVVLGVLCGTFLGMIHARLPIAETLLVSFGLFILLGGAEKWLLERFGASFNCLLTCIVTGAVFANVAIDSQRLETTLRTVGFPIFAGFFVLAGFGLHVGDLAHMGWVGGAYVACRFLGKVLGCHLGVRWVGGSRREATRLGSALLCQAAVVIGLAAFVERNWESDLARKFSTVILGSVVLFELIGPLLVKRCVVQAGEVKAITLLRRAVPVERGGVIVRVTVQSLVRLFGWRPRAGVDEPGKITAGHIMRTNVQLIPAAATFDDVLHFIERSTHSHFPVVHEDGELAGTIHFADVRDVIYDPAISQLVTAVDLADPQSAVVPMEISLPELLNVFTSHNVAVLPVVEQEGSKHIVGIVEQRDLLRALHLPQ